MRINNKKIVKIAGIAIVIIIIILAIAKKKGVIGKKDTIKVSTENVKRRSITETVSANGKIKPETEVKITPDVSGEVIVLLVKEGDAVKAGQLLAKINPDIYISNVNRMDALLNNSKANLANAKARLAQVKAQFNNTKSNYERNEKLWKQGVISESEWDGVRSSYEVTLAEVEAAEQTVNSSEYNVKSAIASLKEASDNLTKTSIFAPIDGTISKLNIEKGERVVGTSQFAGTEMMRVSNLSEMVIEAEVNENDIVRVHKNDTAMIDVDAYLSKKFKGIVTEIANSANTLTGSTSIDQITNFNVKIRILRESYKELLDKKNENYSPFRPGMSASVEILTNKVYNVLSVPVQAVTTRIDTIKKREKALLTEKNTSIKDENVSNIKRGKTEEVQEFVFVVDKNIARLKKVKAGIQDNTYIEIIEGLTGEEEVIVAPYRAISKDLKDGDAVKKVDIKELFIK